MIEETATNFRLTALGRRRLELGNGTAKGGLRETSEIDLWYRSVDIGDFYVVEALSAESASSQPRPLLASSIGRHQARTWAVNVTRRGITRLH
jgi:hypothetical protein